MILQLYIPACIYYCNLRTDLLLSRGVYGIANHDIILFLHVFIRIPFKFLFFVLYVT